MPAFRVRLGNRTFAPGLVPTLAMLPLLALLLWLGAWQWQRAGEKRELWDGFARGADATRPLPAPGAAPPPRYSHVVVQGRYRPDRQVLIDNMTHAERAGYRVLTPFETDDGRVVLVDRGWVPLGRLRSDLPDVRVADAPREVAGRLDALPRAGIDTGDREDGAGWPRVLAFPTFAQLERVLGRELYPSIVLLDPGLPDGYVREWRPPGMPPERHVGYSVQWYALAFTLVALWFYVSLRRGDADPPRPDPRDAR